MEHSLEFQGNQIPLEILLTIFEYLSVEDIKNASLTCKSWFSAAMHSSVMDRRVLCIKRKKVYNYIKNKYFRGGVVKPILSNNSLKIELDCRCNKLNFEFQKNQTLKYIFNYLNQFENINSLDIKLTNDLVYKNLKCLIDSSTMTDKSYIQLKAIKILRLTMDGPEMICYLSFFLDSMPELQHIHIKMDKQLCSCCTKKLEDYLVEGKQRIKTLILDARIFESQKLISAVQGMNLTTMALLNNNVSSHVSFSEPRKLRHLRFPRHYVSDNIDLICETYSNVETLTVRGVSDLKGIKNLTKLKDLMVTDEFDVDLINSLSEKNVLEKLFLWKQSHHNYQTTLSFKNLLNLTHLTLYDVKFTSTEMQAVCEHLKQLKHFALRNYAGLTDYGFTGEAHNSPPGFSISTLKHLKVLFIGLDKSGLGKPTIDHIMKIKGLEYLYLSCCERLTWHLCEIRETIEESCPLLSDNVVISCFSVSKRIPTPRAFSKMSPLNYDLYN